MVVVMVAMVVMVLMTEGDGRHTAGAAENGPKHLIR